MLLYGLSENIYLPFDLFGKKDTVNRVALCLFLVKDSSFPAPWNMYARITKYSKIKPLPYFATHHKRSVAEQTLKKSRRRCCGGIGNNSCHLNLCVPYSNFLLILFSHIGYSSMHRLRILINTSKTALFASKKKTKIYLDPAQPSSKKIFSKLFCLSSINHMLFFLSAYVHISPLNVPSIFRSPQKTTFRKPQHSNLGPFIPNTQRAKNLSSIL